MLGRKIWPGQTLEAYLRANAFFVTYYSDQTVVDAARRYPTSDHGKLRLAYFKYTVPAGGIAADSQIELCDLPKGRVRILLHLSRIWVSDQVAGTLDLGHRAYDSIDGGTATAEDVDAFIDGMDIATAAVVAAAWATTPAKFDLYSRAGVRLYATKLGGVMAAADVIEGYCIYVYE